jgi:HAD superfamily hydrolase (TIGR01549 family)
MTVKAIVFDLDGTIVDFNLDYKSARADAIQFLSNEGFPQSLFSINESVFEMLKKVEIYLQNNRINHKDYGKLRKDVLSIMEKYEMESARLTHPLPGILETLQALKKMKIKLGIFTVNGKKTAEKVLSTFKLKPFFSAVVTRDSVPKVKPNPVHLETALKSLKAKPEETIVVGDSVWDMTTAREHQIFAVGTPTGVATPEDLTRAGANCLISSPTDLITLVERLNAESSGTG